MSLSGFLNVNKLEEVINNLNDKIEAQQLQIADLQNQVNNKVENKTLAAYEKRMDSALDMIEKRFGVVEERLEMLQEPAVLAVTNSRKIKTCIAVLELKLDIAEFTALKEEVHQIIEKNLSSLQQDKASASQVKSMEDAQHEMKESFVAFQQLLARKVDRVEVPMLNAAVERVESLLQFRDTMEPRLDDIETSFGEMKKSLAQKENKEAMVQRMQNIHELLLQKTDVNWINDNIAKPLSKLQTRMAQFAVNEETLDRLVEDQSDGHLQVEKLKLTVSNTVKETKLITDMMTHMEKQLREKANSNELEMQRSEDRQGIEQWIKECVSKVSGEGKIQSAYLADMRQEILNLKSYHNTLEHKIKVALRFVDWFTDIKHENPRSGSAMPTTSSLNMPGAGR